MSILFHTSRFRFVIQGLVCGLRDFGWVGACGGVLMGRDWSSQIPEPELRYDLWCEKCHCATAPGLAEESKIIAEAIRYFAAIPEPMPS